MLKARTTPLPTEPMPVLPLETGTLQLPPLPLPLPLLPVLLGTAIPAGPTRRAVTVAGGAAQLLVCDVGAEAVECHCDCCCMVIAA